MNEVLDRVAGWCVPRSSVAVPPPQNAEEKLLRWFSDLRLVVPPPLPVAMRDTKDGLVEIPVDEATDDDLVLSSNDLAFYHPDLAGLAAGCVSTVHESQRRYPGPLSLRRWRLTGRVSSFLYVSGITRSGGGIGWDGNDPIGSCIYTLPRLKDVPPRRGGTLRPYLLWLPDWWWECHARQGWKVWRHHKPRRPFVFGICAACTPCSYCGALYECADDCEVWTA